MSQEKDIFPAQTNTRSAGSRVIVAAHQNRSCQRNGKNILLSAIIQWRRRDQHKPGSTNFQRIQCVSQVQQVLVRLIG
jgi:hypothetical protein